MSDKIRDQHGKLKKQFTEEMALNAIKTNPCGITLTEIQENIGCKKVTATELVSSLEKAGKITRRKVGASWLYIAVVTEEK